MPSFQVSVADSQFHCLDPKMESILKKITDLGDCYPEVGNRLIQPGDVCFDIGANIGTFSTYSAKLSEPNGRVFSFEPCLEIRELLLKNLVANQVSDRVSVSPNVMSDAIGNFSIKKAPRNMGATRFIESATPADELFTSTTLDLWIETVQPEIDRCDFIKIDVEGMEIKVLKGAKNILQKYRPILYIEVCLPHYKNYDFSIGDLEQYLSSLGYHFFRQFSPLPFSVLALRRLHSLTQGSTFYNLVAIHPTSARYPKNNSSSAEAFGFMIQEKLTIGYNHLRQKFPIRTTLKKLLGREKS